MYSSGKESKIRTLIELNSERLRQAQDLYGGVYITYIDIDVGVSVEVEESLDSIAFTVFTENYEEARYTEGIIKEYLRAQKVSVYKNHEDWERAVLSEEEFS